MILSARPVYSAPSSTLDRCNSHNQPGAAAYMVWDGTRCRPLVLPIVPFELGVFLFGVIAYKAARYIPTVRWASMAAYVVAVIAIAVYLPEFLGEHRFAFLSVLAILLPMIFELTKDWRVDRFPADMSFPLYLVHWPIMLLVWDLPKPLPSWPGMTATILAIVSSSALVVFVERPIDLWRHSRFRDQLRQSILPTAAKMRIAV